MSRKWAPQTRHTLRHNTASIIQDLLYEIINISKYLRYVNSENTMDRGKIHWAGLTLGRGKVHWADVKYTNPGKNTLGRIYTGPGQSKLGRIYSSSGQNKPGRIFTKRNWSFCTNFWLK